MPARTNSIINLAWNFREKSLQRFRFPQRNQTVVLHKAIKAIIMGEESKKVINVDRISEAGKKFLCVLCASFTILFSLSAIDLPFVITSKYPLMCMKRFGRTMQMGKLLFTHFSFAYAWWQRRDPPYRLLPYTKNVAIIVSYY